MLLPETAQNFDEKKWIEQIASFIFSTILVKEFEYLICLQIRIKI